MGLTEATSEFIARAQLSEVPPGVRHLAKRSILDGLGLAIAGSRSEAARIAQGEIESYRSAAEDASVLGAGFSVPARFAAFLNGLAIHADDYDDTQLAVAHDRVYGLLTHPTAPVLPAVLAIGERDETSGADALLAYLVGVEVETKVSEAISPRHYDDGFHSTATVGAIGAGAAAAESGVLAASLAQRDFTAAPNILEARRGFFSAAGGGYDASMIEGVLGDPWTFESPGISIKPHPSGSLTHPAMGALLDLLNEHDIRASDVRSVRVGTNRHMPNALIHHHPKDQLAAKFSMEFCMAILVLERRAGLAQFTDEVVNRPDVQAMLERIEFVADPAADEGGFREMTSIIDVELVTGQTLHTRAEFGKGSPANPMTDEELIDKFQGCLDWAGMPSAVGQEVAARVLALEDEPSLRGILAPLRSTSLATR